MAKSKKAGIDGANTVELIPTLGLFDVCDPKYFEREGWILESVSLRGQGGIGQKKEHYDEREETVHLAGGKKMTLPMKDRMYSLFRSVTIKGSDLPSFRNWIKKNLPFFSVSISTINIVYAATGERVNCRIIGRLTKNVMSKKFIAHMYNGKKMTTENVHTVAKLLNGLVYGYCSYDYSAGKRNVICDS